MIRGKKKTPRNVNSNFHWWNILGLEILKFEFFCVCMAALVNESSAREMFGLDSPLLAWHIEQITKASCLSFATLYFINTSLCQKVQWDGNPMEKLLIPQDRFRGTEHFIVCFCFQKLPSPFRKCDRWGFF